MGKLYEWAAGVTRWLRSLFPSKLPEKPRLLEEFYTDKAALYRYEDDNIPGCVEVWKIVHRQATADLAILLIDSAQLKQELASQRPGTPNRLQPWQREMAGELETAIKAQDYVDASHLWVVVWLRQERRTDRRGRRYSVPRPHLVGVWAVDLQGVTGTIAGNRYASRIAKFCAQKILSWEDTSLNRWEDFVNAIPWLKWLETFTQKIIHPEHNIRPIKRKYREARNSPTHF